MKLNKYIAAGVLTASMLGLPSCSSDFLDEELPAGYTTAFFETPEGIQALTLSLYGHVRWIGGYEGQGYYQLMGGTDEFGIGTDASNEMWLTYDVRMSPTFVTLNGNTGTNGAIWDEMYYGIANSNTIIAKAELVADEAVRRNCLAHAYFMRGFDYYLLVSQFGHCVIQNEPAIGVVRTFELTTPQQCWEQVIADFRKAYELFDGEKNTLAGEGISWTKATAAHYLTKALLFAASERNADWNSSVKEAYLKEALEAANYAISARNLESDVIEVYGNWTGPNCPIEKSNEVLMSITQDDNFGGRTACRNPGAFFNCQTEQLGIINNSWRGCINGGKGFQRFRPTEYAVSVFDNTNDARLWKSFRTVYGTAMPVNYEVTDLEGNVDQRSIDLGDTGMIFILNKKDEHKYDKFKFGANVNGAQLDAYFVDEDGRLAEGGHAQTRNGESTFGEPNTWIANSWIQYQNGKYVGADFGKTATNAYGSHGANMYPTVNKNTCGYLNAWGGDMGSRDMILARLAETYLMRAEIKVRLNDYSGAKQDIDVLRRRGAWHEGENRSYYVDGCYEAAKNCPQVDSEARQKANESWNPGMNTYYLSNPDIEVSYASTENEMTNWTWDNLPAEDEAILAKIGVSGQFERALNFILNEHTRELIGEYTRWEHLSRTKTLETRAVRLNPDVLFFDKSKHYVRPIPQAFIDNLQNPDGTNLSEADKAAWQNPGY